MTRVAWVKRQQNRSHQLPLGVTPENKVVSRAAAGAEVEIRGLPVPKQLLETKNRLAVRWQPSGQYGHRQSTETVSKR